MTESRFYYVDGDFHWRQVPPKNGLDLTDLSDDEFENFVKAMDQTIYSVGGK